LKKQATLTEQIQELEQSEEEIPQEDEIIDDATPAKEIWENNNRVFEAALGQSDVVLGYLASHS
jgi:hypothetical protein